MTARALGLALALALSVTARQQPPQPPPGPPPGPDSQVQPGTPTGDVIKAEFDQSQVFPGTWREYWVYIPKQLDRAKPAPVMVFQDGLQYNAPTVFDNLIHKRQIPPMVAVFVMHGRVKAPSAEALDRMPRNTDGPAVNDKGELFFSEPANNRIHRVGLDGTVTVFAENTSGANGMMFGPDGRLYAGATRSRQIVAYDVTGKPQSIADDVMVNDLAVNVKGDLYFTDSNAKKVWYVPRGDTPRVVDQGIEYPNGVMFSPDQTLLYVSDHAAQLSWVFQIQADGSLAHKQKYFYVHMPDAATRSSADGMAADTNGSVYIATALGVQVFDQIGKCHAIIPAPARGPLSSVKFGGPNLDELYVTNAGKVFKRKVKTKGVVSWRAPIKPPPPRL